MQNYEIFEATKEFIIRLHSSPCRRPWHCTGFCFACVAEALRSSHPLGSLSRLATTHFQKNFFLCRFEAEQTSISFYKRLVKYEMKMQWEHRYYKVRNPIHNCSIMHLLPFELLPPRSSVIVVNILGPAISTNRSLFTNGEYS